MTPSSDVGMVTAWVLAWLGLAYLAGEAATRLVGSEPSPRRFAAALGSACAYFAAPVAAGYVTYLCLPPMLTICNL